MTDQIYKYFSAGVLPLVFNQADQCRIKCSYPKDYNDPYELFLGVDPTTSSDLLAVYREIVFEIPQRPTTCFSSSPIVTPMWAHYADNHSGFVLEFDTETLRSAFEDATINAIDYRDEPDHRILGSLERAAVTKKPRHAIWLRQGVMYAAYFSKHSCWSYEQEQRLVVSEDEIEDSSGNMVLPIPIGSLKSLIVGKNSPAELRRQSKEIARENGLRWFQEIIGKSHPRPFFADSEGDVFEFDGSAIVRTRSYCAECREPISEEAEFCSWCGITEFDAFEAAKGNPLRILDRYGALGNYLTQVDEIEKAKKR